MKMTKKAKILASSVAAIALSSSLIAGSTFALFTSDSSVNIAVTSGKVQVTANIGNVKTYSMDKEQENLSFANGGFASVDGQTVTLDRVSPGDKVEIPVTVTNNSNISVLYRTKVSLGNSLLAQGLQVSVSGDSTAYAGVISYVSDWKSFSDDTLTTVTVELPKDAGNEYNSVDEVLRADVNVTVEAIQANGAEEGTGKYLKTAEATYVSTDKDMKTAIANGENVVLTEDVAATKTMVVGKNDFNLDLNGKTLGASINFQDYSYKNSNGITATVSNGTISGSGINMIGDHSVLTLDNVTVNTLGTQAVYAGYGDKAVINSGTYAGKVIYGADSPEKEKPVRTNYYVDLENKTLTDINKKVFVFAEMEYEYLSEAHGVVLKLAQIEGGDYEGFDSVIDEDGYLRDNNGNFAYANRFLLNLRDSDRETAAIKVKGGMFKNFNPGNNVAEGTTNVKNYFVAEGHTVVYAKDEIGDYWFKVIEKESVESFLAENAGWTEEDPFAA